MTGRFGRVRFLAAVVLPAAVLMALEIVSSRLLAPQFGNSVYVWGSIIGVFLAAMSIGYVLGGRLADRRPELDALGLLLLLAAVAEWGTALVGRPVVRALGEATAGRPAGTLLATAILFGPATTLLATVSPFAVKVAGRERERLGNVAGGLFALSTAGSLAGTLLATFVLIPALGLDRILALLVAATALAALLLVERAAPRIVAAAVAVLAFAPVGARPTGDGLRLERVTPYQTIVVTETDGRRRLTSDGTTHSEMDVATRATTLAYPYAVETLALFAPDPARVLMLGMGAGSIGELVVERHPGTEVLYAELDPAMLEVAKAEFGFAESDRLRVEVADGRRVLEEAPPGWNWIYCDTYIGQAVPFHLATREFFELAKSRLAPGGVVGVNLAGRIDHPFARAIVRTLRRVFARVEIFAVRGSGNYLLVAHDGEGVPGSELDARGGELDAARAGPGPWPRFATLASRRISPELALEDVPVLVDGYAPVDALLHLDAREARLAGRAFGGP